MKIVITGANGLVGQHLGKSLIKRPNLNVICTGINDCRIPLLEKNYRKLNVSQELEVRNFLAKENPDILVNCAAISHVDICEEYPEKCNLVNIIGVQNLIKYLNPNSKFVQLSTDFVFEGLSLNYSETNETNPVNTYGKSKQEAEKIIQKDFVNHQIIRTILVYGFGENLSRNNILTWVHSALKANNKINVVSDQYRKPTYIKDLAKGIEELLYSKKIGIFHLSGEEETSVYQLALKIAEIFEFNKGLIKPIQSSELKEKGKRPAITGFNLKKTKSTISFNPLSLNNALIDSKNGLIKS